MSDQDGHILIEVLRERERQDKKWGPQDHPNGSSDIYVPMREIMRQFCDQHHSQGDGTWLDILREEVYEAFAESDPIKLRAELVQVCAVGVAWIGAIDRAASKVIDEAVG